MGHRASIHRHDESIESARDIYGQYDIVYSNRLHVLLLAMSAGAYAVPVLSAGQSQKIRGVFEDLGLSARIVEAGRVLVQTDTSLSDTAQSEPYLKAQRDLVRGLAEAVGPN